MAYAVHNFNRNQDDCNVRTISETQLEKLFVKYQLQSIYPQRVVTDEEIQTIQAGGDKVNETVFESLPISMLTAIQYIIENIK